MQFRRCLRGLFLIIGMFLGFSLWASGNQDPQEEGGNLVVKFWTAPNQGQFDFWNTRVADFNEAGIELDGKKVVVELQMMPETPSSEAGIQNALATDTAPALSTNINRGFAATLAASGRIYDLSNEDFFDEIIEARAMQTILPGWEIDGGQYVIPIYANAMGYHWNVRGLRALGFEDRVPETMDDVKQLIGRFYEIKETTMKTMGISHLYMRPQLMHPEWWWDRWFDFQMQYEAFSGGGDWVSENSLTLDPDITEEVFEFFGLFGSSLQTAEDWTAFEQEEVPVVFQVTAPWDIPKYEASGKVYGFDGDYVYGPPIVRTAGDIPYTFADSKGFVFYKGGNITEEAHRGAVAFVNWCYTGERGVQTDIDWVKVAGMLPVRGDLLENPAFSEMIASNPAYGYQAEVMPYAIPAMAHEKMADIQAALGEKGLTPYIQGIFNSTSLTAPDASSYIEAVFSQMINQGELD